MVPLGPISELILIEILLVTLAKNMYVLMKFADDINPRPAVTTDKDWNTSWKGLDESAERDAI